MKQYLPLLLLLVICNISYAQQWSKVPEYTSIGSLSLNGNVKKLHEYHYKIENGIKQEILEKIQTFNKKGMLVSKVEKHFEPNGKNIDEMYKFYYINHLMLSYSRFMDEKLLDSVKIKYDRKGRVKEKITFGGSGNKTEKVVYTYLHDSLFTIRQRDANNKIVNMLKINYLPDKSAKIITLLNGQLQVIKKNEIVAKVMDDENISFSNYVYDDRDSCVLMKNSLTDTNGHIIESVTMNGNKNVDDYRIYEYEKDRLISEQVYAGEEEKHLTYVYKQDKYDNIVETLTYDNGQIIREVRKKIFYREN